MCGLKKRPYNNADKLTTMYVPTMLVRITYIRISINVVNPLMTIVHFGCFYAFNLSATTKKHFFKILY